MNKASFLSLIRQASRISDQEVEELEKLVVNFPYCQSAHLLLAKAAYDKGSMLSNQKLKKAAIYAANRQLLKKLIYTSDATVALQPVPLPEERTEKEIPQPELLSETKPEPSQISEPAIIAESQAFVEAAVESETLSEPAEKEELLEPAEVASAEKSDSDKTVAPDLEKEQPDKAALAEAVYFTDHEDAAIAEEILEEGYLPLNESAFLSSPENQDFVIPEPADFPEPNVENETAEAIDSKTSEENSNDTNLKTETELATEDEINALKKEPFGIEKIIGSAGEALTAEELDDQVLLAEEIEIAGAFENPEAHEIVTKNQEAIFQKPETEPIGDTIKAETGEVTPTVQVLNDDLLQETLANFDHYLFRPEKENEEALPEEDVKVVNPENEIQAIYHNDSIGYWMNSSRMGESLEFKNELTTAQPYDFHPELIWEYNKTHELSKEIKPVPSKLSHQLDIIDNFLKMTPRLKAMAHQKIKTEAQEDLSSKSSKINKNLASENFAHILVQQGKIKKAIKIYEHLILKIPEKKAYFAAQIEKLQNPE